MNEFIKAHLQENPDSVSLRYHSKDLGFPLREATIQIDCRQRARRRLSRFLEKDYFKFPSSLSAEQATHQCVADYHSDIIGTHKTVADLTAGLGIDAISFAMKGNKVTAVELDEERARYLEHNSRLWEKEIDANGGEIEVVCTDSLDWLKNSGRHFDVIYVDPARRDANKKRVFLLSDCLPDVVSAQKELAEHADRIIIKASPLLDIFQSVEELPLISDIRVVCVNGECKEVLLILDKSIAKDGVTVSAVDLRENQSGKAELLSLWECTLEDCNVPGPIATSDIIAPGNWIYDPNAGMQKLRASKKLCETYPQMYQVSPNTNLFVSDTFYPDFPGRIFKIESIPDKSELKNLKGCGMEVISRNYPLRASEIMKKFKLTGSSEKFIIASRIGKEQSPKMLICSKSASH